MWKKNKKPQYTKIHDAIFNLKPSYNVSQKKAKARVKDYNYRAG